MNFFSWYTYSFHTFFSYSRKMDKRQSKEMRKTMKLIKARIENNELEKLRSLLLTRPQKFRDAALAYVANRELFAVLTVGSDEEALNSIKIQTKQLVELLLELGADFNARLSLCPPYAKNLNVFEWACRYSSVDVVKMMIDRGANIQVEESELHPMSLAFRSGDEDKIKLFLDRGTTGEEINRLNLLHEATYTNNKTTINLLTTLVDLGGDISGCDARGNTVLNAAVAHNNFQAVKFFVEKGADVNKFGSGGGCNLKRAVCRGNLEMLKYLLKHGATIDREQYLFSEAAEHGQVEIAEFLLDLGVSVEGKWHRNPISIAARNGHEDMVKFLVQQGVELNDSLLVDACASLEASIVEFLLKQGLKPNTGAADLNVLSWAIYWKVPELVDVLLKYGANIDFGFITGKRPLHCAISEKNREMVQLLLDRGADVNARFRGGTPLMNAWCKGSKGLCRLLIKTMLIRKCQNVAISEINWELMRAVKELKCYQDKCAEEIELLKSEFFTNLSLSYLDFLIKTDPVGALACNRSIIEAVESNHLQTKFPIYKGLIIRKFSEGTSRNKDFELIKRFFNYLSGRDHDQLPQLPFCAVREVFFHLDYLDVGKLRRI